LLAHAKLAARADCDPSSSEAFAGAEERADAAAASAEVARVLAQLSARDRDALLLFAWADMSYSDIASALGIPVGTVRSRLNRARRQFRHLIEPELAHHFAGEHCG
jgi:RNA polymerase sigma-70 factor (ECF subfamily)